MRSVVAVLLVACTLASGSRETPVTKVVELLQELKNKISADQLVDQAAYDKFACWCEKTTQRKATAISDAKSSIESLSQRVLELKGSTATLLAEITQLRKEVASNTKAQKKAEGIRESEREDYISERSSLEQSIGALEGAVHVLSKSHAGATEMQDAQLLSVAASVGGALRQTKNNDFLVSLPASSRSIVEDFVQDPSKYYRASAGFSGLQVRRDNPASAQIQGILKGMYDSLTADLTSRNAAEAMAQQSFEELHATKASLIKQMSSTQATKEEVLSEDRATLADLDMTRDETQASLIADERFFVDTRDACKARADTWAERIRMRTEEKSGISKAIGILDSDDAKETFGRATSLFLEESTKHARAVQPAEGPALVVPEDVLRGVDRMMEDLRDEEASDVEKRDYCKREEEKATDSIEDLIRQMRLLDEHAARLESKKKEVDEAAQKTGRDIQETEDVLAEAFSQRNVDREQYRATLQDDVDAIGLLGKAVATLSQYYEDNKIPLKLVQRKTKLRRALAANVHHEEPESQPDYDEEVQPEMDAMKPSSGSRESGGIISIMGYLKEDLENEVLVAKKAELQAQEAFLEQRSAGQKVVHALKKQKVSLEYQSSDLQEKIDDAKAKKEGHDHVKSDVQDYKLSLKDKCDWIKANFESRRLARIEEITGLQEAKAALTSGTGGVVNLLANNVRRAARAALPRVLTK